MHVKCTFVIIQFCCNVLKFNPLMILIKRSSCNDCKYLQKISYVTLISILGFLSLKILSHIFYYCFKSIIFCIKQFVFYAFEQENNENKQNSSFYCLS